MSRRTRAAAGQRRKAKGRRLRVPWIPILLVGVLLVGGYFVLDSFGIFGVAAGERVPVLGRGHIPDGQAFGTYNSRPATSGPHWPAAARWGAYSEQLPDERTVHNLEHGGIVIAYNAISPDDIQKLTRLRSSYPRGRWPEVKIVIEPYKELAQGTITLAGWGWLDTLASYDEQRILAFIRAHMDKCCESGP